MENDLGLGFVMDEIWNRFAGLPISDQEKSDLYAAVVAAIQQQRDSSATSTSDTNRVSKIAVDEICSGFWERIKTGMHRMKKREDFKRDYQRSHPQICCVDEKPSLLLEGLERCDYFPTSMRFLQELHEVKPKACYLVNASGSGKTRTLYEVACQQLCIYLVGSPEKGVSHSEGSMDLKTVADTLENMYPPGEDIPVNALAVGLQALFISRLSLLVFSSDGEEQMDMCHGEEQMDMLKCLFKQVYFGRLDYPGVVDPWNFLTTKLLALVSSPAHVSSAYEVFEEKLSELLIAIRWNERKGMVVLDECQQVGRYLCDRFRTGVSKSSMLDVFFPTLESIGVASHPFLMAGTGGFLLRLIGQMSETAKDRLSLLIYGDFGGWESEEHMEAYTRSVVVDTEDFNFELIFKVYAGRFRFYVTALQHFLVDSDATPQQHATEYLMNFWVKLATLPGHALYMNRSVFDDVVKFFVNHLNAHNWHLVKTLVLFYFFGLHVYVAVNDQELEFVQVGIGRFVKGKPVYRYDTQVEMFERRPQPVQNSFGEVTLGEPIVARALWEFMKRHKLMLTAKLNALGVSLTHSELGGRYEIFTVENAARLLDGKIPALFVSEKYRSVLRPIYNARLKFIHGEEFGLVQEMLDASTLLHWLDDFEAICSGDVRETFRPFLHSGSVTSFGPDVICGFVAEVTLQDGSHEMKPMMCLLQHKLKNDVDLNDAFTTLNVEEMFLHGKKNRSADEEKAVRRLSILCNEGGVMKLVVATATEISEKRKSNVQDAAYGGSKSHKRSYESFRRFSSAGALVGILDSDIQFMEPEDENVMEAIKQLKHVM